MTAGRIAQQCFWAMTRNKALAHPIYKAANIFLRCYHDAAYGMERNGEFSLLHSLKNTSARTIFDVGANVGNWAAFARQTFPAAKIHCFEIYGPTASTLERRFSEDPLTAIVNAGLSDHDGIVELALHPDAKQNSLFPSYEKGFGEMANCRVTTGDAYCAENGIKTIDFLKIDVEGAENLVFAGFKDMFGKRAIRFIQFEYGYINAYTKWLAHDYVKYFDELGYAVGRIASSGVRFDLSWPQDNDFDRNPNFLAVRREDMHLLKSQ